jgi:hypothetical protein
MSEVESNRRDMFAGLRWSLLVACINWKSTAHNQPRPRFPGRDNGAAGSDPGKILH